MLEARSLLLAFVVVYPVYLLLGVRGQNLLLLAASWLLYGAVAGPALALLVASTACDYWLGLRLAREEAPERRRRWMTASIVMNVGILCFFKYFDFFIAEAYALGIGGAPTLRVIMPLGLSYYTLQRMTYAIDLARRQVEPTRDFVAFALFVSFFPTIVCGPIERARTMLKTWQGPRQPTPRQVHAGFYLVVWGLFKKTFVADRLARLTGPFFASGPPAEGGAFVLLMACVSIWEIYADFSGYTDIARGVAKFLGVEVMQNFRFPLFAANPGDLWKRWHISLYSWLRDYLYIPLTFGGARTSVASAYRAALVVMLVSGVWHGAGWTYLVWGIYWGLAWVLYMMFKARFPRLVNVQKGSWGERGLFWSSVALFFLVHCVGLLLFRSATLSQWIAMLGALLSPYTITPAVLSLVSAFAWSAGFFVVMEAVAFRANDPELPARWPLPRYTAFLLALIYQWTAAVALQDAAPARQFFYAQY